MKFHSLFVVKSALLLASSGLIAEQKPNLLIVFSDDQGYNDVGCYGSKDIPTPHLDALAKDGVKFTSGYVTAPYCSPSRAGILSGKYQQSIGHESNPAYDETNQSRGIDPATPLMPMYFKEANYFTAAIGKWHVGEGEPFRPIKRGFDHFWGFLGGGHYYFHADPKGKNYTGPIWIDNAPSKEKLTYLTDDLTTQAIRVINDTKEQPFLIYLAYNSPHWPDQAKRKDIEAMKGIKHGGRRVYAAMCKNIDDNMGRLVESLKKAGKYENTIIFFLSDNGGRFDKADSRPLRGNKGWLYEGGIRVPFIMSYPAKVKGGITYDHPVISLDIIPTALAAGGQKIPKALHGKNILPSVTNEALPAVHDTLHWRVSGGAGWAIRKGKWKLVNDICHQTSELYDLSVDKEETNNLAKKHPEIVIELLEKHIKWNNSLIKPRWGDAHVKNYSQEWNGSKKNGHRVNRHAWHLKKTK